MKITLNRTISFLLALAMVVAMLPAFGITAYAATLEGFFDKAICVEPGKIRVEGWGADLDNRSASVEIHVYLRFRHSPEACYRMFCWYTEILCRYGIEEGHWD